MKAALQKPRRRRNVNAENRRKPPKIDAKREMDGLTHLTEQLVTAVMELQDRVAGLEERYRYGGRLSDELVTPAMKRQPGKIY